MFKYLILPCLFFSFIPKTFGQLNAELIGDAVNQGNNCYLITPDAEGQHGAVWYGNPIDFTTDFEIVFDAYFGINDANGADGIALVLKPNSTPQLGNLGGEIGYGGISHSLAVEFDTWQNTEHNDPIADHIGLMINGNANHNSDLAIAELPNLENGQFHEIKFSWNAATQTITITKDCVQIIAYTGNIVNQALNGSSTAYFGFTGSTGGSTNEQKICFKRITFIENLNLQDQNICIGDHVDTIDATVTGAISYNWTPTTDISDPTSPTPVFSPSTTTTYQVEITEKCGETYTESFTINTYPIPTAATPENMKACGDIHGLAMFNLTDQDNDIQESQTDVTVTYYTSQPLAESGNTPLTSPFESGSTTIYARVENKLNPSCYAISSFNLEVYETPFPLDATSIPHIEVCDNTSAGTDTDGFVVFDITQRETAILNGQDPADFTLSYYTDDTYTSLISNPSAFENTISGGQTIYVRVTNNQFNDCLADTAVQIEVFSLPIANNPGAYLQCDDASNDGQAFFNLTLDSIKAEVNPDYAAEGLQFTYYEDQTEAENNGTAITNPEAYLDDPGFVPETIYIRIENSNGCYRVVPLTLEVSPYSGSLALYNPDPIHQCDDGLDPRDGVATFDLSNFKDHIENVIFSTFNTSAHLYESQSDAELEINEITDPNNHQNMSSPYSQNIWVRVKSDLNNNCLGLEEFPGLLIVEALPLANPITIARQCDDDFDGAYPFLVSAVETTVLGGQSYSDVSITYYDSSGNPLKDFNGNDVTSPLPNTLLIDSQTITIRVTNNNTSDPDGPCFHETTLEFIVDAQPVANPLADQVVCDGDAGDIDDDGKYPFDTSNFTSTILGAQTGMEIYYNYTDENGMPVTDSPTLPNTFLSGAQTITAEVINPLNTACSASTNIQLLVNQLPDFTIETPQIVCSSDPTFTIVLDPVEADPNEVFDYEWHDQNGSVLSNDPTLSVSTPGTYTITLTKTNGTGCSRSREAFVNASELATIAQGDITIVDLSDNNTITINENNLGLGDYEFALDDEFGFYRDEPFFEQVKAGIYTLFVRDKKGCGTASIDISVIGYPKFFTPNNDGFNDYWQIKGVNTQFQPNSSIYIFDRYGKLIKQLATSSNGWDGSFNGERLSSDDYWFKVILQDGRTFMGHFTLKR
ncbi:T9SS type B sorting domain-containing protein [Flavivirga sp. 57AJ16]|uniref:lectin-like domain-containing protein n=1 Tax=Flavivirga sp. 57AJ16 TaxID=3025307 RepID=UPI0023658C05|nr:T9SS type B sorting domain-containing protein [Flavivirga sp. 57AJ16]MDD7885129.1 T9SS type B sorting domain-containing protein [Flavivirga sp. 57AJ16]